MLDFTLSQNAPETVILVRILCGFVICCRCPQTYSNSPTDYFSIVDEDCAGGLICYSRPDGTGAVPGCTGPGEDDVSVIICFVTVWFACVVPFHC